MVRINLLPVASPGRRGRQAAAHPVRARPRAGRARELPLGRGAPARSRRVEAGITRTRSEIAQLDRIIGEVKDIKAQQAEAQEARRARAARNARTGPVKMLDELATLTPKRLWLRKLDEKGGAVTPLEGTAATIDDVSELMAALKGSTSSATSSKEDGGQDRAGYRVVDFTMTANVACAVRPSARGGAGEEGLAPWTSSSSASRRSRPHGRGRRRFVTLLTVLTTSRSP